MNYWFFSSLLVASAAMMVAEMRGAPVVLQLSFKGDIKRESLFLQQWGQLVATAIMLFVVYSFDRTESGLRKATAVAASVCTASIICFLIKRSLGRVRPNREQAGKFLGPSLKHANWRESFPSSHSACAFALSVSLSVLYPQAAGVLWFLAICTALLRYLMDAHWPADVLAGVGCGYACGHLVMNGFGYHGSF